LAVAIAEKIRQKIVTGELPGGTQLRQGKIAAEFQVSPIPVREALRHLAAEGLITIVPYRGASVSSLSAGEIGELFETRAVLESYLLGCAVPNLKDEDFKRADGILSRFEQSLRSESEAKAWGQWNWRFHSTLYVPANRPFMLRFVKMLNRNCDRYARMHLAFTRNLHLVGDSHRKLLNACRTRDPQAAREELWNHITEAGEYLKQFVTRNHE
jgi:DNA-binding GntR family transcriptional regulator